MEHGLTLKTTNGSNNTKRRIVSISSCHKTDDGTYVFVGKSRLHGSMRDTESKVNRVCRYFKLTCYERWKRLLLWLHM